MRIKSKKRLGQNFLIDDNILRKIILASRLEPNDTVLEVGAGRGELTEFAAQNTCQIHAVEFDTELCRILEVKFRDFQNVLIIESDILKFNLKKYFGKNKKGIKVIGNIPYYISSAVIEHLIHFNDMIDSAYLTVQKEFGQRVVAPAGSPNRGAFSCFVEYYAEAKILFSIANTCFRPIPKVESCVLQLRMRRLPKVNANNQSLFFKIIRASFNQRRKVLRNSLKGIISGAKLDSFFSRYGLDPQVRPEKLTLADFANLSNS